MRAVLGGIIMPVVTFVDEEIGKIIRALKEKGMYDRSLIIFVADHGDMLGDHHHWRKTYPYEGSSHIPFLVKWPAGTEGMLPRVDVPVELRDVLPTMLAAAGADVPADMDGRPLQGLLGERPETGGAISIWSMLRVTTRTITGVR